MRLSYMIVVLTALMSSPSFAYIGPGVGLGALGAFFAIVAGVLLLLLGFVWYPLKRLLTRKKQKLQQLPENDG